MAETGDLKSLQCGFESHRGYQCPHVPVHLAGPCAARRHAPPSRGSSPTGGTSALRLAASIVMISSVATLPRRWFQALHLVVVLAVLVVAAPGGSGVVDRTLGELQDQTQFPAELTHTPRTPAHIFEDRIRDASAAVSHRIFTELQPSTPLRDASRPRPRDTGGGHRANTVEGPGSAPDRAKVPSQCIRSIARGLSLSPEQCPLLRPSA